MFACLLAPDFAVQATLLEEPKESRDALRRSPIAILDGPPNLLKVAALNDAARKAGIEIGMTKLQVETCGGVLVRNRSADSEDFAQDQLLECAGMFSPRLESTCPGTAILDLTGMEKLFGPPEKIACKILVKARQMGLHLRIALAANPDAAHYAARGFASIKIIPPGEEAKELAPLAVSILPATAELLEVLESWGIHKFGALASLPALALAERLGQEGLKLQKLAQGRVTRPLRPLEPKPEFMESHEFDEPVETLPSLTFILNRLLEQICDRLRSHSFSTNELRLTLDLEVRQLRKEDQKEQYRHEWKLPVPTQDKNVLFTLLRLDLERNTFSAPIKQLTIEAIPIKPRTTQHNLFAPPSPESGKLEVTLARIRGVVGSADRQGIGCVGSPKLLDTHQSGAFTVEGFSCDPQRRVVSSSSSEHPAIALRMFRPALETRVELNGEVPHLVWLWKKHRRVLAASGPWSSSGNWWDSAKSWAREEWDVALKTLEGIGYYRIYLDRLRKQWFVEGVFD
jgi:protein ImuB